MPHPYPYPSYPTTRRPTRPPPLLDPPQAGEGSPGVSAVGVLAPEVPLQYEERAVGGGLVVDVVGVVFNAAAVVAAVTALTMATIAALTATVAVRLTIAIAIAIGIATTPLLLLSINTRACVHPRGYYIFPGHHWVEMSQGEHSLAHRGAVFGPFVDHPLGLVMGVFSEEHIAHLRPAPGREGFDLGHGWVEHLTRSVGHQDDGRGRLVVTQAGQEVECVRIFDPAVLGHRVGDEDQDVRIRHVLDRGGDGHELAHTAAIEFLTGPLPSA